MDWYWAWIVQITEKKDGTDPSESEVWKNLIIIEASTAENAYEKAANYGASLEGDAKGSLLLDGSPARCLFLGVQAMGRICERIEDMSEILFQIERCSRQSAEKLIPPKEQVIDESNGNL